MEAGKAKVADPEHILDTTVSVLYNKTVLAGKRMLVTAGSTVEYIDPIRVMTNLSSGKMGVAIAQEAKRMGAAVTLVYGHGVTNPPSGKKIIRISTGEEMYKAVLSELSSDKYDVVIMTAAVADFAPLKRSDKKIDTRLGKFELSLTPTRKIIDEVKNKSKDTFLVAFKADYQSSDSDLIEKAYRKLKESNADIVVANDIARKGSEPGSDENEVFIVKKNKEVIHLPLNSKVQVAQRLLELVAELTAKSRSK
jgi:phosphopantothenoylcysteine decarboxylase/phosphopantothenate--cysteine ligase